MRVFQSLPKIPRHCIIPHMQRPPRTHALSVFAKTPPVKTKAARDAEAWRRRAAEHAQQLGLPPLFSAYIATTAKSKAKIAELAAQYRAGCVLTGLPFEDKYNRTKNIHPNAAVRRQDGSWVTYAAWLLTQEGKVPDIVLIGAARLIAAKHTPKITRPEPRPAPPQQEPAHGFSSLLDMEPRHQDYSEPSDPAGYGEPAEPGYRQGTWSWSDDAQSVVFNPS